MAKKFTKNGHKQTANAAVKYKAKLATSSTEDGHKN